MENSKGSDSTPLNPYAPPTTPAQKILPGASGIDLQGRSIHFSGSLSQRDVSRALGQSETQTILFLLFLGMATLSFGVILLSLRTGSIWLVYAPIILLPVVLIYSSLRQSGWWRAARMKRASPRSFVEHQGEITEKSIHYQSQFGRTEYPWESVVGIKLQRDSITLALTPQHTAFIFLPRRFFQADDWQRLTSSISLLAPALPFRAGFFQQADARRMISDPAGELGDVPADSIMLDGYLTTAEFLSSAVGLRLIRAWVIKIVFVTSVLLPFLWAIGAFQLLGDAVFLLAIIPAIWLYRFGKIVWSMFGRESKPIVRLRAAASESTLRLATPRGTSTIQWTGLGDATVGDKLILLRETRLSPNVIPLPRKALVEEKQWDALVQLVRRKMAENESQGS